MTAGAYVCVPCRDDSGEECSDYCGVELVDELPPLWMDWWPTCECCKGPLSLLEPLVSVAT